MIDPRLLREDPDRLRASQRSRGEREGLVDDLVDADAARRAALAEFERLRAEQKILGRSVAKASAAEKPALLHRAQALAAEVRSAESVAADAGATLERLLLQMPNLVEEGVPVGGEDDYVVLEHHGQPRDFAAEGFLPADHLEIGRRLEAIDTDRAAKVSGSRFAYLTGDGALLEFALVNMAMAQAVAAGFVAVVPPVLVRPRAMEATGFLGQAAENVFTLPDDDFYLVGTAEVPLAAYHADEILDVTSPRRYAGFSPCFRREAGTYGKDTKGIFRVHQFDKVEMFSFCHPDEAPAEHRRLLGWERQFWDALEVPYRVIETAAGDLGLSAARKFDIEAWLPAQGRYREVTSASNCGTFQARRLHIRTREAGAVIPVATLNGTLVAIQRAIVALFENHQQADGSVRIPAALSPYLAGRTELKPPT